MKIYLMAKNVLVTDITSEGIKNSTLSLGVYDGNTSKNAVFVQTQSLTDNLIGITDYGLMTFNSENTNLNAIITVTADVEGHGLVSKTLSVQSCLDTVEGTELGTGGGGGGTEYTAGYGIEISANNEISVDEDEVALKSDLVDIGVLAYPDHGYYKKFNRYVNGVKVNEYIEYFNSIRLNNIPALEKRGGVYAVDITVPIPESFRNIPYLDLLTYNIRFYVEWDNTEREIDIWGQGIVDFGDEYMVATLHSTEPYSEEELSAYAIYLEITAIVAKNL